MDPLFQLIGSIAASRPAAEAIDAFVQGARRERAAVMAKSAHGATFVRFNASDLRLVTLACRMLRDSPGLPLRFAFAVGYRDPEAGPDGMDIGTRNLEQAQTLAAAGRDGQVLVAPQLTGPLVEAGFTLRSRQLRRPGAEPLAAFLVDVKLGARDDVPVDSQSEATTVSGAFDVELPTPDSALRNMSTQLEAMARRQIDLEWRQQQLLGRLGRVDVARVPGRSWDQLLGELDLQMGRIEARLGTIDGSEQRLQALQISMAALDKAVSAQLPRLGEIEQVRQQCDGVMQQLADAQRTLINVATLQQQLTDTEHQFSRIQAQRPGVDEVAQRAASVTHLLGDIQLHLERLSEQREVIDQVGERLARLDFTMQEAQNTLHALQRERDVAERIEHSLKALRARTAARPVD